MDTCTFISGDCWLSSCSTSHSVELGGFLSMQHTWMWSYNTSRMSCTILLWRCQNSNLGGGKRFSARHQKYTSVTGKKKMADYKVCNKLGCKHMDPKGWKFEQHKCYVQKEWREGCAIEDLVSLKCLDCHSLLEEQPKTMVVMD